MAIKKKRQGKKQVIDLTGPDGNAFVLLGIASRLGRDLGMTRDQIKRITEEMRLSDYEHLIRVFDREFGHLVDLER